MATVIYQHPHDARRRLADLGVAGEAIVTALRAGHLARLSCTDNDPPFIPGTEAWRFVVRTLREELLPKGSWRKSDPANFSLVINDDRKINIVVASGDSLTRRYPGNPTTKSLKGLYTEAVTVRNKFETDLFPDTLAEEVRNAATVLVYPTYVLLIYITDDEFRCELSLPDEIEEGRIINWIERIFIPDDYDEAGAAIHPAADSDPEIDVPVRRKA